MKLTAYDYETQRWVKGKEAYPYLLKQYQNELILLNSHKAQKYVDSFTFPCTIEKAKSLVIRSIKELEKIK